MSRALFSTIQNACLATMGIAAGVSIIASAVELFFPSPPYGSGLEHGGSGGLPRLGEFVLVAEEREGAYPGHPITADEYARTYYAKRDAGKCPAAGAGSTAEPEAPEVPLSCDESDPSAVEAASEPDSA